MVTKESNIERMSKAKEGMRKLAEIGKEDKEGGTLTLKEEEVHALAAEVAVLKKEQKHEKTLEHARVGLERLIKRKDIDDKIRLAALESLKTEMQSKGVYKPGAHLGDKTIDKTASAIKNHPYLALALPMFFTLKSFASSAGSTAANGVRTGAEATGNFLTKAGLTIGGLVALGGLIVSGRYWLMSPEDKKEFRSKWFPEWMQKLAGDVEKKIEETKKGYKEKKEATKKGKKTELTLDGKKYTIYVRKDGIEYDGKSSTFYGKNKSDDSVGDCKINRVTAGGKTLTIRYSPPYGGEKTLVIADGPDFMEKLKKEDLERYKKPVTGMQNFFEKQAGPIDVDLIFEKVS